MIEANATGLPICAHECSLLFNKFTNTFLFMIKTNLLQGALLLLATFSVNAQTIAEKSFETLLMCHVLYAEKYHRTDASPSEIAQGAAAECSPQYKSYEEDIHQEAKKIGLSLSNSDPTLRRILSDANELRNSITVNAVIKMRSHNARSIAK